MIRGIGGDKERFLGRSESPRSPSPREASAQKLRRIEQEIGEVEAELKGLKDLQRKKTVPLDKVAERIATLSRQLVQLKEERLDAQAVRPSRQIEKKEERLGQLEEEIGDLKNKIENGDYRDARECSQLETKKKELEREIERIEHTKRGPRL